MTGSGQGEPAVQPCLFMLFPVGERPWAADVRAALDRTASGHVSHDPAEREAAVAASDWLELILDGLTFDLLGLAPGRGLQAQVARHVIGIKDADIAGCEAIGIAPGPHLAGAASAMPVVRAMLRLAASLASEWTAARAAFWLPAASAMRRDLFVATITRWLHGGPFPALGLVGITELAGGVLATDGLAFFTGQEMVLDASLRSDRLAGTRLLIRLIDLMVEQAPLAGELVVSLDDGGRLRLVGSGADITVSPG